MSQLLSASILGENVEGASWLFELHLPVNTSVKDRVNTILKEDRSDPEKCEFFRTIMSGDSDDIDEMPKGFLSSLWLERTLWNRYYKTKMDYDSHSHHSYKAWEEHQERSYEAQESRILDFFMRTENKDALRRHILIVLNQETFQKVCDRLKKYNDEAFLQHDIFLEAVQIRCLALLKDQELFWEQIEEYMTIKTFIEERIPDFDISETFQKAKKLAFKRALHYSLETVRILQKQVRIPAEWLSSDEARSIVYKTALRLYDCQGSGDERYTERYGPTPKEEFPAPRRPSNKNKQRIEEYIAVWLLAPGFFETPEAISAYEAWVRLARGY